jgi:hypothetical protein
MYGLREPDVLTRTVATSLFASRDTHWAVLHPPSDKTKRLGDDVAAARDTAISALNNDRFRVMLDQITDPGASGVLMTMGGQAAGSGADVQSARSSYAENSD